MIIHIALFEDMQQHSDMIANSLNKWAYANGREFKIKNYNSPMGFNEDDANKFDCIFLDVKLPDQDGISFAHEIRKVNLNVPIIFISNYIEYSLLGYEVNALRFLNKSSTDFDDKINECMSYAVSIIESGINKGYTISSNKEYISVAYREILYITIRDHILTFCTQNGSYSERNSLKSILSKLPAQFIQCSRSNIVNIWHIARIYPDMIKMRNGDEIPLTGKFTTSVLKAYSQYY